MGAYAAYGCGAKYDERPMEKMLKQFSQQTMNKKSRPSKLEWMNADAGLVQGSGFFAAAAKNNLFRWKLMNTTSELRLQETPVFVRGLGTDSDTGTDGQRFGAASEVADWLDASIIGV